MSDKGMLAAREATPEPAGPDGRSPSPAPLGAAALSPTAAAAAAAGSGLLNEQLSGRLETVGEEGGAAGGGASTSGYRASESGDAELAGGEEYDPETAFADEGPKATGGAAGGAPAAASTPTAAALDWASIKAAAAAAGHEGEGAGLALQPLKFETLAKVGAKHEGQQAGAEGHRHHRRERPSASPRNPEASSAESWGVGSRGGWDCCHAATTCVPSLLCAAVLPLRAAPASAQPHATPTPTPVQASDGGGSQPLAEPGSPHSLRHLVLQPTDPACLFGKGEAGLALCSLQRAW